jgi:hypothetical protein
MEEVCTQMFAAPQSLVRIRTEDFAGRWFACDDGWLGTLTLAVDGEQSLSGTFASERFHEDYRVTALSGVAGPHAVRFTIHDFNWLPEQHYEGHLFTGSRGAMAGNSLWKGVPFGFFATRTTRPALGTYRSGLARGEDFAGSWTAYLDGELATIVLDFDSPSGTLRGSCTGTSDRYDVTGRWVDAAPHGVSLTVRAADGKVVAELSGYLMSRPKNAISGTMTVAGTNLGFIMIRYA